MFFAMNQKPIQNIMPPIGLLNVKIIVNRIPKKIGFEISSGPRRPRDRARNWLTKYASGRIRTIQYANFPIL
jgi:hypothetical protein